jgi:hypothetical protein
VPSEKWERNSINNAVVEGGLDQMECSFYDHGLPWRVTHMPSGAYLLIGGRPGVHELAGVVGDGPLMKWTLFTWPSVLVKVKDWAWMVKRDVDTPDLWDEVRRRQGVLTGTIYENSDNSPFTAAELANIADKVQQIKEFVKTQPISEARMLSAAAKLDYVVEASRRLGRKDWAIIFGGAIVSTIVADLLPREVMGDILTMAAQVLGHIFGGGAGPPQFPPMTPPPLPMV